MQQRGDRLLTLDSRQRGAQAETFSAAEGLIADFGTLDVEALGLGVDQRIVIRCGER